MSRPKSFAFIARRRSKRERMAKMRQISLVATAARGPSRRHNMDPRVGFMRFADDDGAVHDGLASTVQRASFGAFPYSDGIGIEVILGTLWANAKPL